jgi:hypothetical protein
MRKTSTFCDSTVRRGRGSHLHVAFAHRKSEPARPARVADKQEHHLQEVHQDCATNRVACALSGRQFCDAKASRTLETPRGALAGKMDENHEDEGEKEDAEQRAPVGAGAVYAYVSPAPQRTALVMRNARRPQHPAHHSEKSGRHRPQSGLASGGLTRPAGPRTTERHTHARASCGHARASAPLSHWPPSQRSQLIALSWPVGPLTSIHTPAAASTRPSAEHKAPAGQIRHC